MENTNELSVFMTGANGGMGSETSKQLLKRGVKRLVLAARTEEKALDAVDRLVQQGSMVADTPFAIEAAGGFDMTAPSAIGSAVAALPKGKPFDVIFLQAGGAVFKKDYQYISFSGQRIERAVFQNAIGGYITLVALMKHGLVGPGARIVFAGGEGARGIPKMIEKPVFEDDRSFLHYLSGSGNLKKYNAMNGIGVSKFASALIVQKLAELNDGRTYVWFSPGLTHGTNGLSTVSPFKRFFAEKIMFGITGLLGLSQSPQQGAEKYADALLGKYGENGEILGAPEGKVLGKIVDQKPMNPSLTNRLVIEAFWELVQRVYPMPESRMIWRH